MRGTAYMHLSTIRPIEALTIVLNKRVWKQSTLLSVVCCRLPERTISKRTPCYKRIQPVT